MITKSMPLGLEKPEFKYEFDSWMPIQLTVEIGEDGYKTEAQSLIHIRTDNGGYPMSLAVQIGSYPDREWQVIGDIHDIGILIEGSYERGGLIEALQRVGLMTVPFYGKMRDTSEEQDDALREQT